MTRRFLPGAAWPWALIAVLILFMMVASLYNVYTPIYEAPDELQHVAFVTWLADGRGLPVLDPEDPGPWEQEGTQPPLYYWLAAQMVGWLPRANADRLAILNPYVGVGDPQRPDNKNRVLHGRDEQGRLSDANAPFVHAARGVSTVMGLGTLVAIYILGKGLFPKRPSLALGMTGFVAFIPQFLFLSASVSNDNLVILISAWVLVLLTYWLCRTSLPGWKGLVALGVLLGLAALTKLSGLLLWLLAAGVLCLLAWRRKRFRWLLLAGVLAGGLALLVSGWWFVRNEQLYGDLTALAPHVALMGARQKLPSVTNAVREFNGFRYSFWLLFGWFNILAPEPYYWIMDGLVLLAIVGLIVFLLRSRGALSGGRRHAFVMLTAWLAVVAAGVLRWTMLTPASQGRLFYPALPVLALFLALGWSALIPAWLRRPAGAGSLLAWMAWAALCPFLIISPAYALPERAEAVADLDFEPSYLNVRYGDCCELVGFVSPSGPVLPGQRVPLTLVWQALATTDENYSLFIHATTSDGRVVGQLDTYHGGGQYQTSLWRPGEVIVDTAYVPISPQAQGPALLHFNVGLHAEPGSARLDAFSRDAVRLEVVFAGEIALRPAEWPVPHLDMSHANTVFEDLICLTGATVPRTTVNAGDVLTVTLQWQSLSTLSEDYVGFVHLARPDGRDVAQDDHLPLNGGYPTRLWTPDTVINDPYRIELPDNLAAGSYELWAGLYRLASGARLQAVSRATAKRWKDDLVFIDRVAVTRTGP
jgi:4-amino-4-deoxy-L-arabinose transferase-like glycosyltransferase